MPWMRHALVAGILVAGCGRTPTISPALLFVATVDGADDPVSGADVELRDAERVIEVRRTDGDGIATFRYPGGGRYTLTATADPQCCFGTGTLDVVVTERDETVDLEMTIGPCPTWIPPGC